MKFLKAFTLLLLVGVLFSFNNNAESYFADGNVITWKGSKVTGSHEGTIEFKSADLQYEDGVLKGGAFVIDMTTITCTDMQGKGAGKLVGHLNSDDFFGIEDHPEANFTIKTADKTDGDNQYSVTGDLTIKGITHGLTFPATVMKEGDKMIATANIKVDRTKYDIKYGSGKFFDNLGDRMISDEFEINVRIES